ncbi:NADH:flavin oxidoreductase [Endozoicomonas arenosclerae]|uniref:NADH:flavin oxidoreductase n=1 Tax=Endozoicomonas arenosclerae TaxID=1633495 RepID=UPI0007823D1B|nr:NADH:flavin oxidoreductase [Endozoicomonas arenosclerae]
MSQYLDRAFSSASLGPLKLRNRIIKAATFEGRTPGGIPGKDLYQFHKQFCDGGVGMTTLAYCATEADGRVSHDMMYMGDHIRPELTRMIDGLHQTGARVSGQMAHCGYFSKNQALQRVRNPKGPSIQLNTLGMTVGRPLAGAMSEKDIHYMVKTYRDAALFMKEVGFDAIEIHFGHGYGLSQFISPKTNRRSDQYGGSLANRMRLPLRCLEAVKNAVGDDVAVIGKMGLTDAVKGGLQLEEAVEVAAMLDQGGIDGLITSGGTSSFNVMHMFRGTSIADGMAEMQKNRLLKSVFKMVGPRIFKEYPYQELYFLEGCKRVRDRVRNAQMIYIGGCHTMESLEVVMREGIDFVQLGRALIKDPAYVNNASRQGHKYVNGCTHCNQCVTMIEAPGGPHCPLNVQPAVVEERV